MKMNGYEKRTTKKKESIIETARELFTQRGITDVSISEIAKNAGVSQVSIYNYFGDKNALAKEVLRSFVDEYMKSYEDILARKLPFSQKLKLILERKNEAILEVSGSYISQHAWEDKALQQVFQEVADTKAKALYIQFIELGKKEGAIDREIPDEAILDYFLATISILQESDFLQSSPEYKKGILKLTLYGILGKEAGGFE
ncbi:TetR/AcrR family transcriptional regulator [Bacillus tuaregi]|uniref:TetR/AcrR family transcriptional regulator n=1 Tax=Bacillus tuaregi TaxID=1816695 RepID=UPI0008F8213D|nr:TetR/AcrR family transcriptional regulator [Bacillus tuaregi]